MAGPGDRGLPIGQRRGDGVAGDARIRREQTHKWEERHLLVDQDCLLVDPLVTPADVQDRDAARILLTRLHAEHPENVLVWADNGYGRDEFSTWAQATLRITIKVAPRPKDAKGCPSIGAKPNGKPDHAQFQDP
ncbi:transposase [Streptomyces sp. R21]|uniref:Transposase n=1 Tax=Streptomyces sp. R21 TaxID=3238627 RepID=A0AB39PLH1_9ACTN